MHTIKDVAKDADVSIATVSNVINQSKYVSDELRERVYKSMEKLNYNMNPLAKNLRRKVSQTLGVVLQNVNDVFFSELLMGLEACVRENNYNLMFFNTNFIFEEEKKAIQQLRSMWIDGILLDSCVEEKYLKKYNNYLFNEDSGKRIPLVLLERDLGRKCNAVTVDNYNGAFAAVEHLILSGRKDILFLSSFRDWIMLKERTQGYEDAMNKHRLTPNIISEKGDLSMLSGYDVMRKTIEYGKNFDGIFVANDRMAIGAIIALKEYGKSVPQDVAVVGFDNIDIYKLFSPALTTVNVPKYQMGYKAAEMLINLVESEQKSIPVEQLKTNLIIRESSDENAKHRITLFGL